MSSPNEIGSLAKIMVKPMSWRVLESPDHSYTLSFTYVDAERGEFAEVLTRRGDLKVYKSVVAVLSDIAKVQAEAAVYFFFHVHQ